MDAARFDHFARLFTAMASRRTLLGRTAFSLAALRSSALEAKKRRKRKRRKPPKVVLNAFGCVNVGGACLGVDALCCSGICEGKKPRKGKPDRRRCQAHNVLDCPAGADNCVMGLEAECGTNGHCFRTTGAASFCGRLGNCFTCQKDVDCEPSFGAGAACVVCAGCVDDEGTACEVPAV